MLASRPERLFLRGVVKAGPDEQATRSQSVPRSRAAISQALSPPPTSTVPSHLEPNAADPADAQAHLNVLVESACSTARIAAAEHLTSLLRCGAWPPPAITVGGSHDDDTAEQDSDSLIAMAARGLAAMLAVRDGSRACVRIV